MTPPMLGAEFNAGLFSQPFRVNFVLVFDRPCNQSSHSPAFCKKNQSRFPEGGRDHDCGSRGDFGLLSSGMHYRYLSSYVVTRRPDLP